MVTKYIISSSSNPLYYVDLASNFNNFSNGYRSEQDLNNYTLFRFEEKKKPFPQKEKEPLSEEIKKKEKKSYT